MKHINKRAQTQQRGRSAPKNRPKQPKRNSRPARLMSARGFGRIPSPVAQLSECVLKYATAISDPWSPYAEGACVPIQPSRPSQKVKAFARATVAIGTAGVGGFYVMPCLGNDSFCLMYTNSAFATSDLTGLQGISSNTIGISTAVHNGPWSSADVITASLVNPPLVQGRIVSAGVSTQYTGTVLNQGGLYYMLVEPNHQNLNNATAANSAGMGAYAETLIKRVTNAKEYLVTSSLDITETEYFNPSASAITSSILYNYPYSSSQQLNTTNTTTGGAPMCVYLTGTPGNTFEVEVVFHLEFVGRKSQALLTPSHADSKGYEIVASAAAKIPAMRVATPNLGVGALMARAIQGVTTGLQPAFGAIGQGIGTALGAYAGAYVGAPMIGGAMGGGVGRSLGGRGGQLLLTNG